MTESAIAKSVTDGYLRSSFGLGSQNPGLRLGALTVIFFEELLRHYAPYVFQALQFVLMCIPMPTIFGDDQAGAEQEAEAASQSTADAPIVPDEYVTFVDDRKAARGDENDVYMLQTHGFNKYRHTSASFLKRNKLVADAGSQKALQADGDDDEDRDGDGDGDEKAKGGARKMKDEDEKDDEDEDEDEEDEGASRKLEKRLSASASRRGRGRGSSGKRDL